MDAMTDARLEIGSNHPPGKLELERAGEITLEAEAFIIECSEIADVALANQAQGLVDHLRLSKKDLAAAQKVEIAPYDEAVAEVKAKYRGALDTIEAALKTLLERSSAWLAKERARIAAEKAAKEAEARRLREEADRLERERQEATRRVEDEKRRLAEASAAESGQLEDERQEAELAASRAAEAARTAKAAERVAEKKPEVAAIKGEASRRAMTLRTYWSAVIIDETAAIDSYKAHPAVRKAALAAALQVANEAARAAKNEAAAPLGFRFVKEERAS